jgi:hypothetical protein
MADKLHGRTHGWKKFGWDRSLIVMLVLRDARLPSFQPELVNYFR